MNRQHRGSQRLQRFRLVGVQETGAEIGRGSYAAVVELQFRGLKCAGKKLYPHLYGGAGMLQRFEDECELLGQTQHPNIVQFLGVAFEEGTELPMIVMEFMHTTLSACIDRYGILPQEVSYSILGDVATALCYLHGNNPQIIHRDLTANNILLSRDMKAKIADLGVAKILDYTPARMTQMTTCPGTPAYMPPESLEHNPAYATSIDTFSFGVTMVHLLSGQWPLPSSATVIDPSNPARITPRTEAERRQEYLDVIGRDHPLMALILECISNNPTNRPDAETILGRVREAARDYQPVHEDKIAQTRAESERTGQQQQDLEQLRKLFERNEVSHGFRMRQQKQTVNLLQQENTRVKELLEARNRELQLVASTISAKDQEIQAHVNVVEAKSQQIQDLTCTLHEKEQEIALKQNEVEQKETEAIKLREENEQALEYMGSGDELRSFLSNYSKLTWTRGDDLPADMTAPQSVVIDSSLYVGGGNVGSESTEVRRRVFQYDSASTCRRWSTLPRSPQFFFGLGLIQGSLAVVGGLKCSTLTITGEVCTYNQTLRTWERSIPPMPTPRSRLCVASSNSGIIACGGLNAQDEAVNTVEIFQYNNNQWQACTSLPEPISKIQCTMIGNRVYFMGGYKQDESASRKCYYTEKLSSIQPTGDAPLEWKSLPDLPVPGCTPIGLNTSLLAIGGIGSLNGIHLYDPASKLWLRIGNLPQHRTVIAAAGLSDKIIISGGWNQYQIRSQETYIGHTQ